MNSFLLGLFLSFCFFTACQNDNNFDSGAKELPDSIVICVSSEFYNENSDKEEKIRLLLDTAGKAIKHTDSTVSDKKSGKKVLYFNNGKKAEERNYEDGKRDGRWLIWYSSGNKWNEQFYKNGKRDSTWTWWDEKGNVQTRMFFKNDTLTAYEESEF